MIGIGREETGMIQCESKIIVTGGKGKKRLGRRGRKEVR